jgi:hypothetical protein
MHHVPPFITHTKNSIIYNAILVYKNPHPHPRVTPFIQTPYISYTYFNIIIISRYSKVLKSSKTGIFNIQLVRFYKTTYIFCKSIIHKNNSFSVSRILTLAAQILSTRSPRYPHAMHYCKNNTLHIIDNF